MNVDDLLNDLPNEFLLPFPCFAVRSKANNKFTGEETKSGDGVSIFTDKDLAEEYVLKRLIGEDREIVEFQTPQNLLWMLSGLSDAVTRVYIDPSIRQLRSLDISKVMNELGRMIRE